MISLSKQLLLSALIGLSVVNAAKPQPKNKDDYSEFSKNFGWSFLNWEPYEAVTSSGWTITVFRVYDDDKLDSTLEPVLVQPGGGMVPEDWTLSWVSGVARDGYELWLMTQRGMRYTSNSKDDTWTLKERWDFSWAEQGSEDIPAVLDVAL